MTRLDQLDPTRPDDAAFDPDGPQAQRVFTAAQRTSQRAPRRRVALALATVAAAAAATVVITTTTSPTDARAALLQAAEDTAEIDSGRVVWTLEADLPSTGYKATVRNELRFSGEDIELVSRSDETLPTGQEMNRRLTFRFIDGIGYERDETQPEKGFVRLGSVDPGFSESLTRGVSDGALLALVRSADDLAQDGDTYTGTATAGEVEDAMPSAPSRSKGPAWDRPVRLEVTVQDDLVRRLVIRGDGTTRTTEYLDLGTPQVIERPAP